MLPGFVGVPALELVYARFAATLARLALRLPPGSNVAFECSSTTIGRKRDSLVTLGLLKNPELQWILFLDSDQDIPIDTLDRLMRHNVPIVAGLIMKKDRTQAVARPFPDDFVAADVPHVQGLSQDGSFAAFGGGRMNGRIRLGAGLQAVEAVGTGCLLVQREVFAHLGAPWFVPDEVGPNAGTCEDLNFCDRARAAGYPIYVDTDLVVPHLTVLGMTPALATAMSGIP